MAEAEARREARRRKILENSEKRLNKISGVEQKSTKIELDGIRENVSHTDSNRTRLIDDRTNNIADNKTLNYDEITSTPRLETTFQNVSGDNSTTSYNCQDVNMNRRFKHFPILFIIPVILSFILIISDLLQIDLRSIYLNKIFIPLLIYEIIEYFALPKGDSSSNFLTSLLLLTNIKNKFVVSYIAYFHYVLKVMQDLMVYFFVFTLSHGVLSLML